MSESLILGAVGDIAAFHDKPETMFDHVKAALSKADISFAQNERHYNAVTATPVGGFTEQVPASHADALKEGGFDVVSFASNHTMDLGEQGMVETVEALEKQGFTVIGVGANIQEARKPAIVERKGTKVGFLAYCSVLRPGYEANVKKAGVAPMRADTLYKQTDYQAGTAPKILTFPHKADLAAVVEDITKLRDQVDFLVVSFHWGIHFADAVIADYQVEVAHAVIDAGADAIVGHHPHMLKGIEVYRGKPIFYSLGNFAFDSPSWEVDNWVAAMPEKKETYKNWGWAYGDPEWALYSFPPSSRMSMVANLTITDNKITRASFVPVMVNKNAQPVALTSDSEDFAKIVDYMKSISASQGLTTNFDVEGDEVVISLGTS